MTIEELTARIEALEAERDARSAAEAEWAALSLEERAAQIAERAATTPDGIYYLTDYQQPADTPAYSLASANSVQAAVDKRVKKTGDVMTGELFVTDVTLMSSKSGQPYDGTLWTGTPGKAMAVRDRSGALVALRAKDAAASDEAVTLAQLNGTTTHMAQLLPGGSAVPNDGQMCPFVINVGTLAPGQELQSGIQFNPGTYFAVTVQHSSTYIYAVVQDLGDGTGYVKVRNTTTSTTHTNIKVHLIMFNPPQA